MREGLPQIGRYHLGGPHKENYKYTGGWGSLIYANYHISALLVVSIFSSIPMELARPLCTPCNYIGVPLLMETNVYVVPV